MPKKHMPFIFSVLCSFTLVALAGGATLADEPFRYLRGTDGTLTQIDSQIDGTRWAAWSYRNGAEFDLAISGTDAWGMWKEPVLIGAGDARDQVDPTLTSDAAGNLYLVYAEQPTGRILLTTRGAGQSGWTAPVAINSSKLSGSSPKVRVVADRLVVAFSTKQGVVLRDLPLLEAPVSGQTTDDPDPVGNTKPIKAATPDEEEIGQEDGTGSVQIGEAQSQTDSDSN